MEIGAGRATRSVRFRRRARREAYIILHCHAASGGDLKALAAVVTRLAHRRFSHRDVAHPPRFVSISTETDDKDRLTAL
ncbi:hypothetical protein BHM03_00047614 [Ensete ventricosum]|uniref:Uncharacterized protein n=1 Tax=Ensete ventricosum TaxID=4639 RepID=A0A426ZMQ3_ENSVE|nr:hypothetical protein B296_00041161 [Ensete ventricosum]RZS15739.1 hypothetical protein BHM03_00047614 [Ensete ventricosum]